MAAIRLFFKDIFGDYAGWAQSVLFAADLADLNNGTNITDTTTTTTTTTISDQIEPSRKRIKVERQIKVES